ncbi:hypothetical protein QVD17_21117 [Tagetes erecta]|uniref:CLAVATA3/ESR (CLE)-related protein 9 n=1 Tax=Tagetes erecta TaxID=13708 RepID=A0AAD8KMH3_TARER|nr:hypothetical protein QVD17_21117 [Tagetes erecta]
MKTLLPLFLLHLLIAIVTSAASPETFHHHHDHHCTTTTTTISSPKPPPPPPCFQSQTQTLHLRPLPPQHPQPPSEEIDPRYGVAKRLVPSGPNPLHN